MSGKRETRDLLARVGEARVLFAQSASEGVYLRGKFVNYLHDLHVAVQRGHMTDPRAGQVLRRIGQIRDDLWNVSALVQRLEWTSRQTEGRKPFETPWFAFSALDIEHFHIEVRSLLDYAGQCLREAAEDPEQVTPQPSRLVTWMDDPTKRAKLGDDLGRVADQFVPLLHSVRDTRDKIVHFGAAATTFWPPHETMPFKMDTLRNRRVITVEEYQAESVIVDFRAHAAEVLVEVLLFLEALGENLRARLPARHASLNEARLSPFGVVHAWVDALYARLIREVSPRTSDLVAPYQPTKNDLDRFQPGLVVSLRIAAAASEAGEP